MPERAYIFNSK